MKKIERIFERPIAFHPELARVFGGVHEAILWQQLYYWSDKGSRKDGFIWKSKEDIEQETTLSRRHQDTARKNLEKLGVLETKLHRANGAPTLHYRVNVEEAVRLVRNALMEKAETYQSEKAETYETLTETTHILQQCTSDEVEPSKKEKVPLEQLTLRKHKTPLSRLKWMYSTLYKHFYDLDPKVYLNGKDGAVLKSLLKEYNEWQIAALFIEHFESKDWKLQDAACPITWLTPRVNQYALAINKEIDFTDTVEVRRHVKRYLQDNDIVSMSNK